jgi:hypothetical protein
MPMRDTETAHDFYYRSKAEFWDVAGGLLGGLGIVAVIAAIPAIVVLFRWGF